MKSLLVKVFRALAAVVLVIAIWFGIFAGGFYGMNVLTYNKETITSTYIEISRADGFWGKTTYQVYYAGYLKGREEVTKKRDILYSRYHYIDHEGDGIVDEIRQPLWIERERDFKFHRAEFEKADQILAETRERFKNWAEEKLEWLKENPVYGKGISNLKKYDLDDIIVGFRLNEWEYGSFKQSWYQQNIAIEKYIITVFEKPVFKITPYFLQYGESAQSILSVNRVVKGVMNGEKYSFAAFALPEYLGDESIDIDSLLEAGITYNELFKKKNEIYLVIDELFERKIIQGRLIEDEPFWVGVNKNEVDDPFTVDFGTISKTEQLWRILGAPVFIKHKADNYQLVGLIVGQNEFGLEVMPLAQALMHLGSFDQKGNFKLWGGEIKWPYLGIYYSRPIFEGVLITRVVKDSPAEQAGFLAGDKILAIDGKEISFSKFREVFYQYRPGDEVTFTVLRQGEEMEIPVVLGER